MVLNYTLLGGIVFVLVLIAIIVISKRRKGIIEIIPETYSYITGETIKGKLILKIKNRIKSSKLIVGLVCENVSKREGDTLFDFNQPLEGKKEYAPSEYSYDFSIVIPLYVTQGLEGVAEPLLTTDKSSINKKPTTKWYLYAELQCKKVNLYKRIQISII